MISQCSHYQPLLTRCSCRKMANFKTLSVCQKKKFFFSASNFHMHIFHMSHISAKCWKVPIKALRGIDFTKDVLSVIIQTSYCKVVGKCLSKPCQFVKKYFFCIKLPHAHLQYVCNISAKYCKDPITAVRGVRFHEVCTINLVVRITKRHNSCKTEPSPPIFLPHMQSDG